MCPDPSLWNIRMHIQQLGIRIDDPELTMSAQLGPRKSTQVVPAHRRREKPTSITGGGTTADVTTTE